MNTKTIRSITERIAGRFNELAQHEKWFEIQDELFSEDVKSIEPLTSAFLPNAEGRINVRKKGEEWIRKIEAVHSSYTSEPVVGGDHFAVGRELDITVQGLGRIQMNQIMVYKVKDGQIVLEQFFY